MQRGRYRCAVDKDDFRSGRDQLGNVCLKQVTTSGSKSIIDANVAAFYPTQFAHPLLKRSDAVLRFRVGLRQSQQHRDAPHLARLLRVRTEWHSGQAPEQAHELTP